MNVHKVIIRFDFPVSYDILDKPGQVMRLIEQVGTKWSALGENQSARQITASMKLDNEYYSYTVQPTNLVIDFESVDGVPLMQVRQNNIVKKLIKLTSSLFKNFEVEEIERAGVRVFCGAGDGTFEVSKKNIENKVSQDMLQSINSAFGKIEDVGLAFDGQKEDLVSYRLRFGPYKTSEAKKYFTHVGSKMIESSSFNHIFDVDVYEQRFSVLASPVHNWVDDALIYASESIQSLFKVLVKKKEEG